MSAPDEPIRPGPRPPDEPHLFFRRGKGYPKAITWLGFTSFWGHLWHFAASAVATEDIDARDWMDADDPDDLTERVADMIGGRSEGSTLVDRLDDHLWLDYVADTGDDSDVSAAVADMVFRSYVLPGADCDDDDEIVSPRGDMLLFGGDTAYPVATDIEIHNRVCVPFNRVLRDRQDGKSRVVMGIPGNHDWYDGLDGFARMFRARRGNVDRTSLVAGGEQVDRGGAVGHLIDWVEAFRVGHHVAKREALPVLGYTPMQNSSYFALRLAPQLDLWAIDRQLRVVDYTQQSYFMQERSEAPDRGLLLMISDPVYTYLEPYPIGQAILKSLNLTLEDDHPLVLVGDTHHFCRMEFGKAMQVIAGGGGAFLHPARINRAGLEPPVAEFPGRRACIGLALQIPWQIAGGRAGFVVHTTLGLMYLPVLGLHMSGRSTAVACGVVALVATLALGMLGGWRERRPVLIAALATLCGVWIGAMPWAMRELVSWLSDGRLAEVWCAVLSWLACIYPATLGFGTFLMVLTLLGLEHNQGFSSLAHPGYKHFHRLRIRKDGSAVDGWIIGKVDTLDPKAETVLVDHYTWRNPRHTSAAGERGES